MGKMKAHIFITDKKTFPTVRDNGFWGVGVEGIPDDYEGVIQSNLSNSRKPYFAMIADMLGTRIGDIVFLYERQVGFHGIYRVKSKPFFDPTPIGTVDGTWPIRVEIECLNYFPKPVPEDLLFSSREFESKCWGWFYRKIQGPRGINTVNPETAEVLIELLVKLHGNPVCRPSSMQCYPKGIKRKELVLDLGKLSDNGKVLLEDILRAWFVQNVDSPNHASMREMLGPVGDIEWFANNVPYHVTRKNIDVLVYHKNDRYTGYPLRYRYTVIELKRDRAKAKDVAQLIEYSKWVAGRLANGEVEMVHPILVAFDFSADAKMKIRNSDFSNSGIKCYAYKAEKDSIEFAEVQV